MYYGPFRGFGCLFLIGCVVFLVYPFWRIVTKAGYEGILSLLFFVPVVNLVFIWFAALNEWPIERQLRELRSRAGVPPTG